MPEIIASGGTCISLSAGIPTTHDDTGFAALTFTQLGGLESVGDITISHSSGSFTGLCSNKTTPIKGAEEISSVDVVVAYQKADAGQVLMSAARKSPNKHSFKVTYPDGSKSYFSAYVMKEGKQTGGNNDAIKIPYSLSLVPPTTGDTIVEVAAV